MDTTTAQSTRNPLKIETTFCGVPDFPTLFEDGHAWRTDFENEKLASNGSLLPEGIKLFLESRTRRPVWHVLRDKLSQSYQAHPDFQLATDVNDRSIRPKGDDQKTFNRLCTDLTLLYSDAEHCMNEAKDAQTKTQLEVARTEFKRNYEDWFDHFADTDNRYSDHRPESLGWQQQFGHKTLAIGKAAERLSTLINIPDHRTTAMADLESDSPSNENAQSAPSLWNYYHWKS